MSWAFSLGTQLVQSSCLSSIGGLAQGVKSPVPATKHSLFEIGKPSLIIAGHKAVSSHVRSPSQGRNQLVV